MNKLSEDMPSHFRMPAEWEPQECLWFSWPTATHLWPGKLDRVQREILRIAALVSETSRVGINGLAPGNERTNALLSMVPGLHREALHLSGIPNNDAWCRDHGPSFVQDRRSGSLAGLDWNFNAWGNKYQPWSLDNQVASRMLESLGVERIASPFVGEGGGLEVDGAGTVLLTESVWLNPNRNAGIDKRRIEPWLLEHLGCQQALWFSEGLAEDDTDGHVDMFARFVKPETMVVCTESNARHPQYRALQSIREQLQGFRTLTGGHFDGIDLPMPEPVINDGEACPATYGNFLIYNEWVFVPQYGQPRNDAHAMGVLGECFPDHRLEAVDCRDLITEGGAIHCLTQQQPVNPSHSTHLQ